MPIAKKDGNGLTEGCTCATVSFVKGKYRSMVSPCEHCCRRDAS